ncbi:MAG: outer membrane beta-barrel protein [Blastocatellia bacterium]|nr:outer membrane beta-barrel protein [Blastocatellia bacterium]
MISKFVTIIGFIILTGSVSAQAQSERKWSIQGGAGFGVPVGGTSDFVGTNANIVLGGGYDFTRIISFTGEFMWQGLSVNNSNLAQIAALSAKSNLYSVTGNIRLAVPTKGKFGVYAIGGTGWYRRSDSLNRGVVVPGTVCTPAWGYWVPVCVNGLVPAEQVLSSRSSDVLGANGGAGFTYKVGENGMKVFAESRYHYAPTDRQFTRVVTTTFGFRW